MGGGGGGGGGGPGSLDERVMVADFDCNGVKTPNRLSDAGYLLHCHASRAQAPHTVTRVNPLLSSAAGVCLCVCARMQ